MRLFEKSINWCEPFKEGIMRTKTWTITAVFLLGFIYFIVCSPSSWAAAEDVTELKRQIEQLQKRVEELEAQQPTPSAPARRSTQPFSPFNRIDPFGSWDPFEEMERIQREMNQMFQDSFDRGGTAGADLFGSGVDFGQSFDMQETDEGYEITFDTTGLNKDKVDIEINAHSITVTGEYSKEEREEGQNRFMQSKSFGSFLKTIPLPIDADTSKVKTEKEGNRLVIKMPKKTR